MDVSRNQYHVIPPPLNDNPPTPQHSKDGPTVSFHDFKSQNFKLSVSNPKSKFVYLSVLSQISNCQSLGRKNKHEIMKTDRIAIISSIIITKLLLLILILLLLQLPLLLSYFTSYFTITFKRWS